MMQVKMRRNEDHLIKNAYGMSGVRQEDVASAKLILINRAQTPMELLEAYFLIRNERELEIIFFNRLRSFDFNKEQWKFILDNSSRFGLLNLREYAEEKFY